MRKHAAVLCGAVFGAALSYGTALLAADEIVNSGIPFVADGRVVSKKADKLVVKTDDHGHTITFALDKSTVVPDQLKAGGHVHVVYHPQGATGQTADTVSVTPPMTASR
jgi:hypothetical protein